MIKKRGTNIWNSIHCTISGLEAFDDFDIKKSILWKLLTVVISKYEKKILAKRLKLIKMVKINWPISTTLICINYWVEL